MAALRGVLHIPRTVVREKLTIATTGGIKTTTGEPAAVSLAITNNERLFSTYIPTHWHHFDASSSSSSTKRPSRSTYHHPWDVRSASYHSIGSGVGGVGERFDVFKGDRALLSHGVGRNNSVGSNNSTAHFLPRSVSTQPPEKPKNFVEGVFSNMKEEFRKNKEMKENLKKFREEAKKLEESEALKEARGKFSKVLESSDSSVFKEKIDEIKDSEFVKKTSKSAEEIGAKTSETVAGTVKNISESTAFKKVSEGAKVARDVVQEELNDSDLYARGHVYQRPSTLVKRSDRLIHSTAQEKTFDADENTTEVVMHKDSKFAQSWAQFKENNQYVNKMFEYKMKYDESDHLAVRMSRAVTEKVTTVFGSLFSKTEMSEVMTEICKMDPTFDPIPFAKQCREDIIPNILEAMIRGDLEVLEDWCHEGAFSQLSIPIKAALEQKLRFDAHVLDITDVEVIAAKLMEQGPVLVITFSAQQIMVLRDKNGGVVEGDPEKILRVTYIWALCRDQEILDPSACWRLIDISASSANQWL